ncbi:scinderin like a [Conger conger]|nr:scinderin like a [Conger conger]
MVTHKEFEKAGKEPGLQIWRVEKMDLKPVPKELYGNFFMGDAYILLHTTSAQSYNLHMWLGSECSMDERCAAAIFLMQLDEFLEDKPVQFREVQGTESLDFLAYFKSGLKYKKGGVASGMEHAVTNDMRDKRLLHVKGRRYIRAIEVEFDWASFNSGDCFIIDLGSDIYHWSSSCCNPFERMKATQVSMEIRDNERGGRPNWQMIDKDNVPQAVIDALGPVPSEFPAATPDDRTAELSSQKMASLHMISDATGSMKTTLVAEKCPFTQDTLSPSECYIVDNIKNNKIFLWKGPEANKAERKAAMAAAEAFLKDKHYGSNVQIEVLPGGAESALFKEFFVNWLDKYETTCPSQAYVIGRIARVEQVPFDASTLHSNNAMAAQHCMVDDGSGKVQIWRIQGGKKVEVDRENYGHFYGGDCYLILYTYRPNGGEKHIIYIWQGLKCTQDELVASAYLAVQLDNSMGTSPVQVRVTQSQETAHLMSLFKDKSMIIHLGGTSGKKDQTRAASTRLFQIRRGSTKATRAVEVQACAGSLNTNDVFVLKTPESLFIWKGVGSTAEEMVTAKYVAKYLGGDATELSEGKEPVGFWAPLGGRKEYQTSKSLQKAVKSIRLFGCSNKTGRLIAEEVPGEIAQSDLATDDIMLLDAWDQIFIWVGKDSNEVEKTGAPKIAKEYLDSDPSSRADIPIITIKQGQEPPSFTGWFQAWDPKMWCKGSVEQGQVSV